MSVIVVMADPDDGALFTSTWRDEGGTENANADFEDDARRGDGAATDPGNAPESGKRIPIGGQKWNNGTQTSRYEGFVMFLQDGGFVAPTNVGQFEVVNASIRVARRSLQYDAGASDSNFGAADSIQFWQRDWQAPLSAQAWYSLIGLEGSGTFGNFQPEAELSAWLLDRTTFGNLYEAGGEAFRQKVIDHLLANQGIGYTITSWTMIQNYPKSASWLAWIVARNDPDMLPKRYATLTTRTQRKHALNGIGGASIQMTDGTAVFLRYDTVTKRYTLYYQKVNQTTPTAIDYLRGKVGTTDNSGGDTQYYGQEPGFQSFSLTRDDSNNIYVAGPRGNVQLGVYGQKVFNVNAFKYNGNFTWARYTQTTLGSNGLSNTDTHRGYHNNTQAVWLPGGPTPAGRLVVPHSRRDGQWGRYQLGVAAQAADLLMGQGSPAQGIAYAGDDSNVAAYWRPFNSNGTNLDAFRDGSTVRMVSSINSLETDDVERSAAMTCDISNSNQPGKPTILGSTVQNFPVNDPDGKMRALSLGDSSPYWAVVRAGHIAVIKKSDGTILRQLDISAVNIPGIPPRSVLQSSQAWDVVWDSGDANFIWIYYKSSINPRIIQKARYNITNNDLEAGLQFTASPLGASGSEIVAIRVPRQTVDARCVLVDVAMQDGAGAPAALITLRDTTMNKAPQKPVLDAVSSFNTASPKQIDWTFVDANPSDFPTAQDIEIRKVSDGSAAPGASHVAVTTVNAGTKKYRYTIPASALSNDSVYQIRVKAYDSVDFASEWSDWVQFSTTSTGGFVAITSPATDNEPLNRASLDIAWTYSNTNPSIIQSGYRVRVLNNDTGVGVSDSGVVTSTAKTFTISGLTSDITYRIEVTVRDSNGQTSGAGIRLITPDFNNPSLPEIIANSFPGYIEIRVANPPPTGDNPVTVKNQIARKETARDDSTFVVIGECPPDGVYQDWTVASGVDYTYKARGSSE